MEIQCQDCATYLANDSQLAKNQQKIKWVVVFSLIMMITEVVGGYMAGSMSLVAEGWHMGSHLGALTITLFAYWLAKLPSIEKKLSFGAGLSNDCFRRLRFGLMKLFLLRSRDSL